MRSRLRPLAVIVLPLASLALAAGCGSSDTTASDAGSSPSPSASSAPPSPSATPSAPASPKTPASSHPSQPKLPACHTVWVEGERLPSHYKGCLKNGKKDDSLIINCSIGNRLATYGDAYYAVPGGPIFKAQPTRNKDKNWQMVYNTCTG